MNHGQPKPVPPPERKRPRIPRSLKTGVIEMHSGSFDYDASTARYGLWKCKVLAPISFFGGKEMVPGDTCELPGNIALVAANYGDLEFCDPRMEEEDRVAKEAARLQIPLAAADNPAFARRK